MKTSIQISILLLMLVALIGCSSEAEQSVYGIQRHPILNGVRVTGDAHLAVVGLVQELNRDDYAEFCTGTLISQDYVLTAAHCVADCDDGSDPVENVRWRMRIGVGQSVLTYRKVVEIAEYHIHPDYLCKGQRLENDIAVLKLAEPVPLDVAPNAYPIGKSLDLTAEDIDSEDGIVVNLLGFGRTGANDPLSTGSKYIHQSRIYARCPFDGSQSLHCGEEKTKQTGMLYFDASEGGTCLGDSGGPALWTKNGLEFVIGLASYGYEDCKFVNADVLVSEYEAFISQFVPVLQSWPEEICDNHNDDVGDGNIDCDDDDCRAHDACKPSIEITDPPNNDHLDNPEDPENPSVDPNKNPDNPGGDHDEAVDSDDDSRSSKSGCSLNEPGELSVGGLILLAFLAVVMFRKREI